jgi:hypothetical protein
MPTLLGRLMARPEGELAALAAVWGVRLPGRGHAEDVAALYRAMTDTWALRDVLEGLSPAAARWLWALARPAGEGGGLPDAPPAVVAELVERGLLHPTPEGAAVLADETGARLRRLAEERRAGDRARLPLAALIATLDGGELAAAAERWGLAAAPGGQPRPALVAALLEAVAAPLALEDLLAGLDRTDRALYALLAARPLALAEVRRRSGLPPAALRRALRHLHTALLVWESWVGRERWLFVPAELRPRSRHGAAPLAPVAAEPAGWRQPLALAWDVLAWLRLRARPAAAASPVPPGYPLWFGTGPAGRAAYLGFLRAAAAGLDEPAAADRWAAAPLAEQQAALFARWRASEAPWPATGRVAPVLAAQEWAALREAVLATLAGLEAGAWYPVEALAARVARGRAVAPAVAPRAATALLQTALVWLGLLEPGREPPRQRPAVRLTPLGAWLLGAGPAPPPVAPELEVEPSLRLLVYAVDAALLWPLLAFAEPEALDRVSLFRLSRASVAAGLAAGLTGEAMLATLARAARHEVPQNVAYAIRDWARASRHARLSRALILTFDDERARDAALALPALRTLAAAPLAQTRLALPIADDEAEHRARAVLRALGFAAES